MCENGCARRLITITRSSSKFVTACSAYVWLAHGWRYSSSIAPLTPAEGLVLRQGLGPLENQVLPLQTHQHHHSNSANPSSYQNSLWRIRCRGQRRISAGLCKTQAVHLSSIRDKDCVLSSQLPGQSFAADD